MNFTSKTLIITATLFLSSTAISAPYIFSYTGPLNINTDAPYIIGDDLTITIVADNGGTESTSQTWGPADVISVTFSLNNAPNTLTTTFSPVSFDNSIGSFTTNGAGVLTGVPIAWTDAGDLSTVKFTNDPGPAPRDWFINGGNGVYYVDNFRTEAHLHDARQTIDPAFWSVTEPAPNQVPAISVWGLGILSGLLGLVGFRRRFS